VRRPSRLFDSRDPIARSAESRQFVDDLLRELAAGGFHPAAWARFFGRSFARSVAQVRIRPAAAMEVTALHLLAHRPGRWRWPLVSWLLCITHLGLLGDRATLGWPNRFTMVRALLPAFAPPARWPALIALATDFVDGRLARRGEESAFGAFADPIADGVFWSWFAVRSETNRWLRWAPVTLFTAAVAGIATAYFERGRAIDYPRPFALRYASGVMQVLLVMRAARRVAR
ncbi:MAG: CDP-alcohol phosphatidyltransferase family protein, partial [bacterium]